MRKHDFIALAYMVSRPLFGTSLQSVKFDDLCTNFKHHEELDSSFAVVTMTKTSGGDISDMKLSNTGSAAGAIPVTVPTTTAAVTTVRNTHETVMQPKKCVVMK